MAAVSWRKCVTSVSGSAKSAEKEKSNMHQCLTALGCTLCAFNHFGYTLSISSVKRGLKGNNIHIHIHSYTYLLLVKYL